MAKHAIEFGVILPVCFRNESLSLVEDTIRKTCTCSCNLKSCILSINHQRAVTDVSCCDLAASVLASRRSSQIQASIDRRRHSLPTRTQRKGLDKRPQVEKIKIIYYTLNSLITDP